MTDRDNDYVFLCMCMGVCVCVWIIFSQRFSMKTRHANNSGRWWSPEASPEHHHHHEVSWSAFGSRDCSLEITDDADSYSDSDTDRVGDGRR